MPSRLRQRVRHFERQRWAAMGGEDEMELIKDLPEGLRRDIKRYLCLDLIKKVMQISVVTHAHLGPHDLSLFVSTELY